MYSTSSAYKTEIKKPSRSFECKITIGDRIYNNSDIVNVTIDGNIQPSDGFMIGTTVSKTLDLTIINSGDTIYSTSQIKVEIGLKIGSTIEYIPMGLYNIDDIEKTDYTTKITAFDNMIKFESAYFSSLGDNPTLQQVVNELAAKTGIQFTGSLPAYTVKKLEGFTCREIVGYVASICGGNAVITRDGKFTIITPTDVSLSIDPSNYINYKREEVKYKVGKVVCKVGEEELSKGSLATDSMELGFENPWVTDSILQDIYNKLNGFNYLGYSMKWQGDLSLDVGDIITVTDVKGVTRKHPVLSQKFNYTGGLTAEIGAKGENKNKNSFSSSGDTAKKVNRVVTEIALVNKAFVDYAFINDADIRNLKVDTAKIGTIEANVGDIKTVLAKQVFTELANVGQIVAGSSIIANEAIGDAQIANLKVGKLLAGDLSTSKFKIVSDSGNMLISDNTIQIKDSSRVRVQIGKDASNDYNMYVWDSTGNLMFDATGLKASGIKSKIIRDDMVSDTANISGNKIEKESLVSQINGATTTLKASKIKFDDINQTLDIAFNSLKTTIYDTGQTVSSQGTLIGTLQGQITTKIWQTDITTAINNVVIGGRNLAQKTSDIYIDATGFTGATNDGRFPYTVLIRDLNVGDNVTVSFTVKYSNLTYNSTSRGMRIQGRGNVTGWGNGAFNSYSIPIDFNAGNGEINVSYRMIITAEHLLNSFWDINFRTDFITGGTISVKSLMIEKGNKKTTWTRALEDVDTRINDNYSSINQTINGINTTVGSMQTSISGHETRIGTAEGSVSTMKEQILLKVEKTDIYNIAGLVTKIDDRDASLIYIGTWIRGNDPAHYNTTYSHNSTANASVKLTFDGVGVRWITSKNTFRGYADVKIDGTIVATNVDSYSATTVTSFVAFEKLGLAYGQHTIEIIVKGTKRAEAASPAVLIDCFEILKEAQTQIDSAVSSISILNNQISSKVSTLDFSSLIEQNPNSVRIAVGQIGGTNLLKGTDFTGLVGSKTPQGWWYWGSALTYVNQGASGYNNAGTICIQNPTSESGGLWQSNIPLKPNTKYTLSLAVTKESNVRGGQFIFEYMNSSGSNISNTGITLNYDGKRHSYTFTTPSNFASVKGGMQHQGSYNSGGGYLIFLTYPKLEEGENSTSWSPNSNELKSGCFEVNDSYARFSNQDGSYTEFTPGTTGLKWHRQQGDSGRDYHFLSQTGEFTFYDMTTSWTSTINLWEEFKGKDIKVFLAVKELGTGNGWAVGKHSIKLTAINNATPSFTVNCYGFTYGYYISGGTLLYNSLSAPITVSWMATA